MQRFLERWESGIRHLIPLFYLAGLLSGTIAFFSGITIGGRVITGLAVGAAAELHTFFLERQVRADYALWRATATVEASRKLKLSLLWLGIMLTLQGACSVVFTAQTYHPATSVIPKGALVVAIGVAIPALSLLAGFLIPLERSPAEMLADMSRAMLSDTVTTVQKQYSGRVKRAKKTGDNLAPVAQALLIDAGHHEHAQRLAIMDEAIPGGSPTKPTKPPKTTKKKQPPKRTRSEIETERARRYDLLTQEIGRNPRMTLNQAQQLLGMRNRAGAQAIWRDVRRELGVVRQQQAS